MAEPATPYLRIDLARLRANVTGTAERAAAAQVALRPHVKTHKSVEIAKLQLGAGAVGITVATIGEAETFASQGCTDIFVAYPLWLTPTTASRLEDVASRARVAIGVDSVAGAAQASRLLGSTGIEVLVEVDSGQHRTGVRPDDAGEVAKAAQRTGLTVRGVFTFPGHSYARGCGTSAAHDESAALTAAVRSRGDGGRDPPGGRGGAAAPPAPTDTPVVNELRPGVYVFGDAQQWELGAMEPQQIALTCRSTVVSHAAGRMVLDAGSKILGADRAAFATGYGRLLDHPAARIVQLSEHHAVVDMEPAPLLPLGSQVDVVPNHVCNAVNLVDVVYADETGVLRPWPVAARGRNS